MSRFGKGMPPFGHSQRLVPRLPLRGRPRNVDPQLGGHGLRIHRLRGALAELAPQHGDLSSAAPTVMIPSAYLPVRFAFSGPAVATRMAPAAQDGETRGLA